MQRSIVPTIVLLLAAIVLYATARGRSPAFATAEDDVPVRWEYLVIPNGTHISGERFERMLNRFGADGWELVSDYGGKAVLKRPRPAVAAEAPDSGPDPDPDAKSRSRPDTGTETDVR